MRFKRKQPIIGRDGPDGRWYIRIPMWMQTTILILTIGLLSLILLLCVSATQTWYFSKKLMNNRLSNFATLIALQIEQDFSVSRNYLMTAVSISSLLKFVTAANVDNVTISDWNLLERDVAVQFSVNPNMLSMKLYSDSAGEIYTYRQQENSGSFAGLQNNLPPREYFPLSFPERHDDIMDQLHTTPEGVLSELTLATVGKDNVISLSYSVTSVISQVPEFSDNMFDSSIFDYDYSDSTLNSTNKVLGYATFLFTQDLDFSSSTPNLFFDEYQPLIVRENNILIDKSSASEGYFNFTIPFIGFDHIMTDNLTYTVSEFPIILDALGITPNSSVAEVTTASNGSTTTFTSTSSVSTHSSTSTSTAAADTTTTTFSGSKHSTTSTAGASKKHISKNGGWGVQIGYSSTILVGDIAPADGNSPSSTSTPTATLSSDHPGSTLSDAVRNDNVQKFKIPSVTIDSRPKREVDVSFLKPQEPLDPFADINAFNSRSGSIFGKRYAAEFATSGTSSISSQQRLNGADLRTTSPINKHSSIGYSYANIFNEKWLVFVQISQQEAFRAAVHLRKLVIGVGVGILSAVVLILLPLSQWQTRGLYVIYQNMRLRPMFVADTDENDHEEKIDGDREETLSYNRSMDMKALSVNDSRTTSPTISPNPNELSPQVTSHSDVISHRSIAHESSADADSERNSISGPDESNLSDTTSSTNAIESRGKFSIPQPLPTLNRWYKDELDELVYEFNNMVEQLNAQYWNLEDQIRMRTREAQKARDVTEKANAAKTEFIAVISHELRTPLNGIMGLTAVNVEENDINKIRTGLKLIIESGRMLMDLLDELLELSKSLVGVEPQVKTFTPDYLLETLTKVFEARIRPITAYFTLTTTPTNLANVQIRGDLDHVLQICLSFMSNSMKFSPHHGHVSVVMLMRPLVVNDDKDNEKDSNRAMDKRRFVDPFIILENYKDDFRPNALMEIIVSDTGVGMSQSQLARIFDLFVQGDDPMRRSYRGAGLGMALSKQLAEGIGGYVTVYSAKDIGSSVMVRVPVEVIDNPKDTWNYSTEPVYFKSNDVYSTNSVESGVVKQYTNQAHNALVEHSPVSNNNPLSVFSPRKHYLNHVSPNSNHASPMKGLHLNLNKASPVSKLLRPHIPNHSQHNSISRISQLSQPSRRSEESLSNSNSNSHSHSATLNSHASTSISSETDQEVTLSPRPSSETTSGTYTIIPTDVEPPTSSKSETKSISKDTKTTDESDSAKATDTSSSERILRVLLAEDNMINQQVMRQMLVKCGANKVDIAGNGGEAIRFVEKSIVEGFHYDLILMDISMPEIDGLEASQFIRVDLGYPYPIVALTGFSDLETRDKCLKQNIQDVLTKPVMLEDIQRVLNQYSK